MEFLCPGDGNGLCVSLEEKPDVRSGGLLFHTVFKECFSSIIINLIWVLDIFRRVDYNVGVQKAPAFFILQKGVCE